MHWLLAYTKPRAELVATEHLLRQGYEVLCPQIRVQKLRRRRWTWLEEPLFPRYIFVGAHDDQVWAPVRSTVGVTALVRFGGVFVSVSAEIIQALRAGEDQPSRFRPTFVRGQKVRIVAGPYASLEAVFEMDEGEDRAAVLLELLGRQNRVRVDFTELLPEG